MTGIQEAIKSIGSIKELAKILGVSYESVRQWKELGVVPASRVIEVEKISGVSCIDLNPHCYPEWRFKDVR